MCLVFAANFRRILRPNKENQDNTVFAIYLALLLIGWYSEYGFQLNISRKNMTEVSKYMA